MAGLVRTTPAGTRAARALRARGNHWRGLRGLRRALTTGGPAERHESRFASCTNRRRDRGRRNRDHALWRSRSSCFASARRSGRPDPAKRASCRPLSASILSTSIAGAAVSTWSPRGILGMEAAGIVESVGAGVGNVAPATASATPVRRPALTFLSGRCEPIFSFACPNPP